MTELFNGGKPVRILAVGNSFSVDGMEYLYKIAVSLGVNNIELGNLYIGGCSLERHCRNIQSGTADYTYYKNTSGEWGGVRDVSIERGLTDAPWDYITIQQFSGDSGVSESYEPYISELIAYINSVKLNPCVKLGWHMTWAYQSDSPHPHFHKYNNDQVTMYRAIINAIRTNVLTKKEVSFLIPCGTAIQNLRTSVIGDTLTRDGHHLSLAKGRYTAGLMWFKAITGLPIDEARDDIFTPDEMKAVRFAVNGAIHCPLDVTPVPMP